MYFVIKLIIILSHKVELTIIVISILVRKQRVFLPRSEKCERGVAEFTFSLQGCKRKQAVLVRG